MNKIISLAVVLLVSISLVGCGNSLSSKAVEQGKLAMASHDYEKALSSFEIAINENTKDPEVREMRDIIEEYNDIKKYIEREDIEKAEKTLDDIGDKYKRYAIKDDIEKLKEEVEDLKTSIAEAEEAEETEKEEKESQEKAEAEAAQKAQAAANQQKSNPPVEQVKPKAQGRVDEYLTKASNTSSSVSQVYYERGIDEYGSNDHISEGVFTEAQQIRYNKWDNLLNEIWGVLKQQLPKNQMDELTKTQRQWIKNKEAAGSSYSYQGDKLISLSESTEQRCYELINGYMK